MFITIDVGGTNTRVGFSADGNKISKISKFATPPRFIRGIDTILKRIHKQTKSQIAALAIGVPGGLDRKKGKLLLSPNLKGWNNKFVGKALEKKLKCPVYVENDVALGALGEATYGAGKNYNAIGYIAVGTGVGGAKVTNKNLDESLHELEPGHQIIVSGGRPWPCNQRGCLEAYASGTAFLRALQSKTGELHRSNYLGQLCKVFRPRHS